MFERRSSTSLQHNMGTPQAGTPTKVSRVSLNSDCSPIISRYGRSHKPKIQDDYVSTDKKVSAFLSPGNQMKYYTKSYEPKKKKSPEGGVKRGRPPKPKTPVKEETQDCKESTEITIKVEPQDPTVPVEGCDWMAGDLAWGRVGGHPFWPCIIALDPLQKIFTKLVVRGRCLTAEHRYMHVQFFGDNGRRSWLNSNSIMAFNGREAFIQLKETILAGMRKKDPKQTSAFIIKPAVVQVWEKAVQEAEDLASATREERIQFFAIQFPVIHIPKPVTREELIDKVLEDSPSASPKKRGRKRKAEASFPSPEEDPIKKKQIKLDVEEGRLEKEQVFPSEELFKNKVNIKEEEGNSLLSSTPRTIADRKKRQALLIQMARSNQMAAADMAAVDVSTPVAEDKSSSKRPSFAESTPIEKKKPKRKSVKKNLDADFQNFCSRHFEKLSDEHPDLSEKEIYKHLNSLWNNMDDAAKSRHRARKGCIIQENGESGTLEETTDDADEEIESSKGSCDAEATTSSPAPVGGTVQKPAAVKRTNKTLFSGVKNEKVCQICEKAGETVRCRGPCQGFYHPICVTNPPPPPVIPLTKPIAKKGKRGRPKMSVGLPIVENGISALGDRDVQPSHVKTDTTSEEDKSASVEVVEPTPKVRKGSKDSASTEEDDGFRCKDCSLGRSQPCFACHQYIQKETGEAKLYRCITSSCGKVYHEECLKAWPQTSWRGNNRGVLTCPQHSCHTCVSDNPGVIKARFSNDKLVRCIKCPTSYHYGNYCLAAGSEILTSSQIICPQHYKPPKKVTHHVNAAWCFICASGGSLICCDLCPTAFHADCLRISTPPDTYVCEDCQTGRFPLYGEIIWVKLGHYRWWPAEILYPSQIPDNIMNLPHVRGEFAVKFFGSHDHYWVNRGRVFLYQDGDTVGKTYSKKSSVDNTFERAVKEASEAQRSYLQEKASREAEARPGMKPPNYVKLKTNKPVGNVRMMDMNLSNLTPCECDPNSDHPCAPDSDCLNRILMVECHPQVCPAGEKCCNQLFEKRQYPPLTPYQTLERGWGLKTLVPLKKGDFVIEYVGEMIDEDEYKRRLADMHERNEDNFYFLTIDKDRMLDAGPKGNVARFMNHSCNPNCETQKWTVNGDTRVGLFALRDIPADTELVFNYNLASTGNDKKPCMCGAPNCSGFIGVKAVKQEKEEKDKKSVKKKKTIKARDGKCFICRKEGDLLRCDGKYCTKGYHLSCLNKKQAPQGYWLCPWHQCNICNKGRVQRCSLCVNSYCQEHVEGKLHEDTDSKSLFCTEHDRDTADDSTHMQDADTKNPAVPMEVDGNSSDNSTTTSSLSSELVINNNVLKTQETPKLRTRRSKSFAGDNTSVEKVNNRRKRPSSVDELLLTETSSLLSNKKNCKSKSNMSSAETIAREIMDEVINNLNVKDKTVDSRIECVDRNGDVTTDTLINDVGKLSEGVVDKIQDDSVFTCNNEKSDRNKLNEKPNTDESNKDSYDCTNIDSPRVDKVNKKDRSSENEDMGSSQDQATTIKKNSGGEQKATNIESAEESNPVVLNKETSCEERLFNFENHIKDDEMDNSVSETKEKENCMLNSLVAVKRNIAKISTTRYVDECSNEDIEVEGLNKEKLKQSIDVDDNLDDFELSYSENSSDKLFKSVNNSESSIEMKVTDCGGTTDGVSTKLEEIHGSKEIVNGIEQSNVMEVA